MQEIDIGRFYEKVLQPLTPSPEVVKLIQLVMLGGETTEDFAQILSRDSELQHWVRITVQRLGFDKRVSKLGQAIILLGQNRIRDLIIGRQIERKFIKPGDTLLDKLKAEAAKAKEKEKSQKKPAAPKSGEKSTEPEPGKTPEPKTESEFETIPQLSDYKTYLEFGTKAEEVSMTIRNSYPGQAFSGGILFDYIRHYLKGVVSDQIKEPSLKNTNKYVEEIFKDGIRAGIAANEIVQKISIPHQKFVFVAALVHNLGKALLFGYDPIAFEKSFLDSTGSKDSKKRLESDEAEDFHFGLDHAQAGSLYLGRLPFLVELDRSIDYHHNPHLLKFSSPKLYALACVLRVSGALAKIYQKTRKENPNVEGIRDQRLIKSEEFLHLKLNEAEWADIKSNYVLKLMKVGF